MFNRKVWGPIFVAALVPWLALPIFFEAPARNVLGSLYYPVAYFPYVGGVLFGLYGWFGKFLKSEPYVGKPGKQFLHSLGPYALLLLASASEKLLLGVAFFAWLLVYLTLPLSHYWLSHAPSSRRWFLLAVWTGASGWLAWSMFNQVESVDQLSLGWGSLAIVGLIWAVVAARQMTFKEAPQPRPMGKPAGPAGTSTFQTHPGRGSGLNQNGPESGNVQGVDW